MLRAAGATLWVVEAGTGGLVCDWMALADPKGEVFVGGEVDRRLAPGEEAMKERLSESVARHHVTHVLGIGPFPQAPGTFHVGIGTEQAVEVTSSAYSGHPDILRERAAKQALDRLRLSLMN